MSEEFIEYEGSPEPTSSRAFGIAAGVLGLILILALACAGWAWSQRSGDGDTTEVNQEIAAIETQNAIIAVTNEAVTATIVAMETEAAQPTNTPPPPTNTPVPTATPIPTNTPVVQPADETPDAEDPDGQATIDASEAMINTPTPIPGLGSGSGSTSGGTSGSGTTSGDTGSATLPETGIEAWGAILAAFALIAIFIVARRLRNS